MDKINESFDKIKNFSKSYDISLIDYIGIIISIIIFTMLFYYFYSKYNLNERNCSEMNYEYKNSAPLSNVDYNTNIYSYKLRDYYIKTAYNACCAGGFKNDYVNICSLKNCIKQGARCLDFEVYSLDNDPVIAASSIENYSIKETYNSVKFSNAMDVINNYAFSGATSPCPNDPLLIHLRIMSNNKQIYDKMATILQEKLGRRLLNSKYSYERVDVSNEALSSFKDKIIIIVDKSNPTYLDTKLKEYVNISSNSESMRKLRFSYGIKFANDISELKEYNKKHMTIVLPDVGSSPSNYSIAVAKKYGCQLIAMCFQNHDVNMIMYEQNFNDIGRAFELKDEDLRYKEVKIPIPAKPDKKVSYKTRTINTPAGLSFSN